MLVCVDWLKEITPFETDDDKLADTLTMLGLEVEEIFSPFEYLKNVVVGRLIKCTPHPNADKLKICEVNVGNEVLKIVCGAPNIESGQLVPVAKVGTILPEKNEVKKVKIRGEYSYGMICSEKELGLGEDHSGIMILKGDYKPGEGLIDIFNLDFKVFDVGITPNRGDCLSHIGIAREISAFYNLPFNLPKISLKEDQAEEHKFEIEIKSPEKCYLYQAKLVKDVKVKPSPEWMRFRLLACGVRPINNIVDITNYILLEWGHPLHAFDFELIEGGKIIVDTAKEGGRFITLDGKERILKSEDLLILDGEKPIALAGIMGGQNSEISEGTKDVLIECAVFDPISIRKTARRLGITTESSYRFERGVDQKNADFPIKRAAYLMQELAEGKIITTTIKKEPRPWSKIYIKFRPHRVNHLLGFEADEKKSLEILKRLGCEIEKRANTEYKVIPPSYRYDLTREVDLIEEIARFCGYDKIDEELPKILKSGFKIETQRADVNFLKGIKRWAKGIGLKEVINYSFVSLQELVLLGFKEDELIKIQNPLTSEQDTLRPILTPGLLKNVQYNLSQNNKNLRFFEIASVFLSDENSETKTKETTKLGIIIQGGQNPEFWPWKFNKVDYLDIKGIIEHLLENLGHPEPIFIEKDSHPFLDPCIEIVLSNDQYPGILGKINKDVSQFYDIKDENIWLAEIDLDLLYRFYKQQKIKFRPWSKYPPVFRDMTIILIKDIKFSDIEKVIQSSKIPYLEEVKLIDIYRPPSQDNPHFTLRFIYRHPNRTLTDKEVDDLHMKLGEHILGKLPIRFP